MQHTTCGSCSVAGQKLISKEHKCLNQNLSKESHAAWPKSSPGELLWPLSILFWAGGQQVVGPLVQVLLVLPLSSTVAFIFYTNVPGIAVTGVRMWLTNKDHYGYYTVGPHKTYSKLDAIALHERTGHHPEWNFNNDIFGLYDWTVEPVESLSELYRQRAQQIRDQYDYLVLFYSGGADSTNILQTFLKNDIKLDEIAQFYSYDGDRGNQDSNFNAEVTRVAIPWSLKIKENFPYINHRVIDQSKLIDDIYDLPEIKFDFLYQQNSCISPNNFSRVYLRKVIKDYSDLIASGKRLCFIWGAEKPRMYVENNRYCLKFLDMIDNCVSPLLQQQNFPGYHDELFYWSPDFTKGLIKQGHAIKHALKNWPIDDIFFTKQMTTFGSTLRETEKWYLTNHGLHTVLYENWDINTFSVGKKRSPILSLRDSWYLDQTSGSSLRFQNGIAELDKILSTVKQGYWKNTSDLSDGIKGCLTRPYFLE